LVDSSTIAFGFATVIGVFLTARLTFLRGKILDLQKKANELADQTYVEFEALLYSKKKQDRDPEKGINIAEIYFKFIKIRDHLIDFYKRNKRREGVDIASIITLVLFGMMNYSSTSLESNTNPNDVGSSIIFIHIIITMYLTAFSFFFFIQSLRQINRIENQLGVGQSHPNP